MPTGNQEASRGLAGQVEEPCVPPERRRLPPEEVPEERVSLWALVDLLRTAGGWVPKRPEGTVYNFAHDITSKTLPAGKWTKIFTLPTEYSPYIVYWKIIVADTPFIRCMPYMDGTPVSPRGIDLQSLYNYGVWQENDRAWCHIYDTVNNVYGLILNFVEPVVGEYDFYIQNYGASDQTLTYLYVKWYQWEKKRIVKVW